MGGAVNVSGNVTSKAEFNIHVDPEAAAIVFAADTPITLVGLDVTLKVLLTAQNLDEISCYDNTVAKSIVEMTRFYLDRYKGVNKLTGCALHDPLAVGVAIDSDIIKKTPMNLEVNLADGEAQGQLLKTANGSLIDVCTDVQSEKFLRYFMETLKN